MMPHFNEAGDCGRHGHDVRQQTSEDHGEMMAQIT